MEHLRHTSILVFASLVLLAVLGFGLAAPLATAEADCCGNQHQCCDPLCTDGAMCHCACAQAGILTTTGAITPIPRLSGELRPTAVAVFGPQLSRDLFRPPRLA